MSCVKDIRLVAESGETTSVCTFPRSGLLYLVSAPGGCQLVPRLERDMWCLGVIRRTWWNVVLVALADAIHGSGRRRIIVGLTPYRIELRRRIPFELIVIPLLLTTALFMIRSPLGHNAAVPAPATELPAVESLLAEARDWVAKGETIQARATLYQAKLLYPGNRDIEEFLQRLEGGMTP